LGIPQPGLAGGGLPHLVAGEGGEEALEVGQGQRSASVAWRLGFSWDFMGDRYC